MIWYGDSENTESGSVYSVMSKKEQKGETKVEFVGEVGEGKACY